MRQTSTPTRAGPRRGASATPRRFAATAAFRGHHAIPQSPRRSEAPRRSQAIDINSRHAPSARSRADCRAFAGPRRHPAVRGSRRHPDPLGSALGKPALDFAPKPARRGFGLADAAARTRGDEARDRRAGQHRRRFAAVRRGVPRLAARTGATGPPHLPGDGGRRRPRAAGCRSPRPVRRSAGERWRAQPERAAQAGSDPRAQRRRLRLLRQRAGGSGGVCRGTARDRRRCAVRGGRCCAPPGQCRARGRAPGVRPARVASRSARAPVAEEPTRAGASADGLPHRRRRCGDRGADRLRRILSGRFGRLLRERSARSARRIAGIRRSVRARWQADESRCPRGSLRPPCCSAGAPSSA